VFLKAIDRFESSTFQRDVFIKYIKSLGGMIRPEVKGRIRISAGQEIDFALKKAA
jgi:hypothetical protein